MVALDAVPSTRTDQELQQRLTLERYPLSAKYPVRWVVDNLMGPNPLWLAESLAEVMPLQPGARVLDMGCGTALTSIFLAKEFGVQVWATDLWVKPTENAARIAEQGLEDRVFPIYAEAHALPYAEGFFDAAVSYDAYHYFGTDDLYIGYYSRFVKPGGAIGFVVPGMSTEPAAWPPAELADGWTSDTWDWCAFHSPAWWRRTLENSGQVTVEHADTLPHGNDDWVLWETAVGKGEGASREVTMLRKDPHLGFTRVAARRKQGNG
jgi:ubiquinone/menaquinone biosynthesis C-methylase UbiE